MALQLVRPSDGRVTNPFGAPPALPGSPSHRGVDFGSGNGLNIYAAGASPILYAGPAGVSVAPAGWIDPGYGNIIVQGYGDGWAGLYAHLAQFIVGSGTPSLRQLIALKGNTGRSTATHLHFELRKDGVPVDPVPYFTATIPAGSGGTSFDNTPKGKKMQLMLVSGEKFYTGVTDDWWLDLPPLPLKPDKSMGDLQAALLKVYGENRLWTAAERTALKTVIPQKGTGVSGGGGSVDLSPVLTAIGGVPTAAQNGAAARAAIVK